MTRFSILLLAVVALSAFSGQSSAVKCSKIGNDLCLLNIGIASSQCNFAVSTSGIWPSADICIDLLNGAVSSCIMCDELRSSICGLMSTASNLLSSVADSRLDTYRRLAIQCQGTNGATGLVEASSQPSEDERRVVGLRQNTFIAAWAKLTGSTVLPPQVPRIGLAASGGGWKSALALLGALKAFDETGTLDLITFMSTLSGSTWSAFPWILSGKTPAQYAADLSSRLYKPKATNVVETVLSCADHSLSALFDNVQSKAKCGQPVSTMDLWGSLLSCNSMAAAGVDEWLDTPMSALQPMLNSGRVPFTIGTTLHVKENVAASQFSKWAEVNPFHFELPAYGKRVPVDRAGSVYSNGQELVSVCPTTMSSWLGAFGSVFEAAFQDTLDSYNGTLSQNVESAVASIKKLFPSLLNTRLGDLSRLSRPKRLNNFLNGDDAIAAAYPQDPVTTDTVLRFVDAGMGFNVPMPPLLRRNMDVYLIVDVSAGFPGLELRKAAAWAKANNLPFQPLNADIQFSTGFYVFDEDKTIAPVIYMLMENTQDIDFSLMNLNSTQAADCQKSNYNLINNNIGKIKSVIASAIAKRS